MILFQGCAAALFVALVVKVHRNDCVPCEGLFPPGEKTFPIAMAFVGASDQSLERMIAADAIPHLQRGVASVRVARREGVRVFAAKRTANVTGGDATEMFDPGGESWRE